MRILIIDDEEPARTRLREMLAPHADMEIAGEAGSGPAAMEMIQSTQPDVLLLDIQMPGCSGLDVAACLREPRPDVIFCTAHEEHALEAFELHAVDYLLKPVSSSRLGKALDHVRTRRTAEWQASTDRVLRHARNSPARFLVRSGAHYQVVTEQTVVYFLSEDGLTRLVGEKARHWMDPTLNDLEQRLDPGRFFRVSRAAMINLNCVSEVHPLPGGAGEVVMKNGDRLPVSRRRYRELLQALSAC